MSGYTPEQEEMLASYDGDDGWFDNLFAPVTDLYEDATDYVEDTYDGAVEYVTGTYDGAVEYVEGTYEDATDSVSSWFDFSAEDLIPDAISDGIAGFFSVASTALTGIPIAFLGYLGIKLAVSRVSKRRSRNIMYSVPTRNIDQFAQMVSQAGGNVAGISRENGYVYVKAGSRGKADIVAQNLRISGVNVIKIGK